MIDSVHAAPACVTVTVVPATVTVPVRDDVLVLAAIVKPTIPPPEPLGMFSVIHEALLCAVHAHPEPAVIHTNPLAFVLLTVSAVGDTE